MLYHYCFNDTFLSILRNSELWLSELTLSNDSMEGAWVWEMLKEECSRCGIPEEHISLLEGKFSVLRDIVWAVGFCMSRNDDVLSQWRGYADNGAGVAIGFDLDAATVESLSAGITGVRHSTSLEEVIYGKLRFPLDAEDSIKFDESLNLAIESLKSGSFRGKISTDDSIKILFTEAYYFLVEHIFRIKNPAFTEEAEWRIISLVIKEKSAANLGKNEGLNFRARGDHIVPYLRLPIPDNKKNCIKEIILGPRNRTPEPVIRAALEKYGFQNVNIRRSAATYR